MKRQLYIPAILLTLVVTFTFCNGKVKPNVSAEAVSGTKTTEAGTPKIKKTQPPGIVNCSLQDKAGNLWFGTTGNGVYRYDGKSFVNFTEKDGLNNKFVSAILEDKSGIIWIGTNGGLCQYDGKKFTSIPIGNSFQTFNSQMTQGEAQVAKNAVWSIMQDKTGKIWFGTSEDGIYCYDGKVFTRFLHNDQVENKSNLRLRAVNSIIEDKTGAIWFATWFEGLCRFDGKSITSFKPNNEVWYSDLLTDKKGDIWIGRRQNGVTRYDGKTFTNVLQHGTFDSCSIMPLLEDKKGNIWFGSIHSKLAKRDKAGGLWRYDGKTFKNFTAEDGLKNNAVWCAVEDKSGNIWMGATNNDVYRFDGQNFLSYSK